MLKKPEEYCREYGTIRRMRFCETFWREIKWNSQHNRFHSYAAGGKMD